MQLSLLDIMKDTPEVIVKYWESLEDKSHLELLGIFLQPSSVDVGIISYMVVTAPMSLLCRIRDNKRFYYFQKLPSFDHKTYSEEEYLKILKLKSFW